MATEPPERPRPAYVLSDHAEEQVLKRKVPRFMLEIVLADPQQILDERKGRKAYQSLMDVNGVTQVLRLIVEEGTPIVVVTVYYTDRVEKYWRAP